MTLKDYLTFPDTISVVIDTVYFHRVPIINFSHKF